MECSALCRQTLCGHQTLYLSRIKQMYSTVRNNLQGQSQTILTLSGGQSLPRHLLEILIVLVRCFDPTAHFSLQAPQEPQELTFKIITKSFRRENTNSSLIIPFLLGSLRN